MSPHWLLLLPLVAGASTGEEDNRVDRPTIHSILPDEEIRSELLQHTPTGTSGVDVLSFTVNTLRPVRPINAYSAYTRAYEASTGKKSGAMRISSRRISVTVAERWIPLLSSQRVVAYWHFDENDKLADIEIERITIGP